MDVICPYCKDKALLVDSTEVLGRDRGPIYYCKTCGAYVRVHKGTDIPMGRLADAELRMHKQFAHAAFDPIWKTGIMSRYGAYCWLAKKLGLPVKYAHMGLFDVYQCKRVIELSNEFMAAHKKKQESKDTCKKQDKKAKQDKKDT